MNQDIQKAMVDLSSQLYTFNHSTLNVLESKIDDACSEDDICKPGETHSGTTNFGWDICVHPRVFDQNRGVDIKGVLDAAFLSKELYFDTDSYNYIYLNKFLKRNKRIQEVGGEENKEKKVFTIIHALWRPETEIKGKIKKSWKHRIKDSYYMTQFYPTYAGVPY